MLTTRVNFKRILTVLVIFAMLFAFAVNSISLAEGKTSPKTLIISTDTLDYNDINYIGAEDSAVGIFSAKTASGNVSSAESKYMTIASGRRVTVPMDLFLGVESSGEGLSVTGYQEILNKLDKDYAEFSAKFPFLGEALHANGYKTSYIGSDSSILMAADKQGKVDYGKYGVQYQYDALKADVDEMLSKSDILVMSYEVLGYTERLDNIKRLLNETDYDVIIIPKLIAGDAGIRGNTTLMPILYKGLGSGILKSDTTKRTALVSNLDMMPTLLDRYGIDIDGETGKVMETEPIEGDSVDAVRGTLYEYLKLSSVKYTFNTTIVYIQLFFIIYCLITNKVPKTLYFLIFVPSISILLSMMMGKFLVAYDRRVYEAVILIAAIIISFILGKVKRLSIDKIAVITTAVIIASLIFNPDFIYNSFIGYNSIVSSGRFFGFNNDIMGTLVGSAAIAYFYIRKDRPKYIRQLITLIFVPVLIVSFTGRFGSNFGGLITAVFLSLLLIYQDFLKDISSGKKMVSFFAVLAVILLGVFIMSRGPGNHIGEFIARIQKYGIEEFTSMVSFKLYQVIANARRVPWILILMMQFTFLMRFIMNQRENNALRSNIATIFATSLIALAFNDTGVVAFAYINLYAVTKCMMHFREAENKGVKFFG